MSATTGQRIGIWIIAVFMLVGTIGSFAIIVLANNNAQQDQQRYDSLLAEYQAEVAAQETELSERYYDEFSQYASRVSAFDAASVTELQTEDLKVGDGEELTADSTFTAYYIGWNPEGTIFDGSLDDGALKAPFTASPGSVIQGWSDGVIGMKVGGVRELTIPSDLAYGETGSGDAIAPNSPIKFVMMVIPTPETVQVPQELFDLQRRLNAN